VAMSLSGDLMMAGRPEDLRAATAISVVTAVLNIGGNLLLIPPFAVAGSLMATAVASGVGLGLRLGYLVRAGRPKSSA